MEEATEKQLKFMKALGIEYDPAKFLSKEDAKEAISDELTKKEIKTVKPGAIAKPASNGKSFNGGAMYTSYAKDIFCELCKTHKTIPEETMDEAIRLVKQAKEAFE